MDNVDVGFRYRLWLLIGVAILLSVAASAVGETAAVQGNLFVPVAPCRVIDTRFDGGGAMQQDEFRTFKLTGVCGIPAGVVAVSANIAAANIKGGVATNGVLKIGLPPAGSSPEDFQVPCGVSPCEAWLNFTKPYMTQINNSGVAVVNVDGKIIAGLFQGGGSADVIIDVNGYYLPGVVASTLIAGTVTCPASGVGAPTWSICNSSSLTVTDARVKAGMLFATTYRNTTNSDTQVPIRILTVFDGGFTAQFQAGTTFNYIATQ